MSGWWSIRSHGSTSRPRNAMAWGKDPNRNPLKISPLSRRQPGSSARRRSISSSSRGCGAGVTSTEDGLLGRGGQGLVEQSQALLDQVVGDRQRREQPDDVVVGAGLE